LFCTGGNLAVPASLACENIYRFPGSNGWDGQMYHYMAHDPLFRQGLDRYVDAPRLRYRRILVPGLAYLLSLGRPTLVDSAYRAVILFFFFAGAYWSAVFVRSRGRPPIWGALFFFIPATLVSLDRLAIDVALAAFCVAFVVYTNPEGTSWKLFAVLTLAALSRETGILLSLAWLIWLAGRSQWRRVAIFSFALLPVIAWYIFVSRRTVPMGFALDPPFAGMLDRVIHAVPYRGMAVVNVITATALDYVALAGLGTAFLLSLLVARRRFDPSTVAMVLFTALGIFVWRRNDWLEVYDYGRIFSPLLILLAAESLRHGHKRYFAPALLILPRVGLQFGPQLVGVALGLFGIGRPHA
jgi:hypothetical protein